VGTPWVIKLGGSLSGSERLRGWLEALAEAGVVIVPGGGPFADQVRTTQSRWRFDDRTAHAMAILAMAQYGSMLAGICPKLRLAAGFDELNAAVEAGGSAVWRPDPAQLPEMEVPASWEVTSDSLAAWLAGRLGAGRLLLAKSAEIPKGEIQVAQCVAVGWVDPAFPRFLEKSACEAWLCGPEACLRLSYGLRHPESLFTQVIHEKIQNHHPARCQGTHHRPD
jgi:aspartokinase-like uncharacterized kinase